MACFNHITFQTSPHPAKKSRAWCGESIVRDVLHQKRTKSIPFFPNFPGDSPRLLSILSGFRGARGTHRTGLACHPRHPGRTRRSHGAGRASRAGGTHRLQGGQQGEIQRGPRRAGRAVHVGHIQVPLIGHQLSGPVGAAQHPGGGHTAAHAGGRTRDLRGADGRTRPRTRRRTHGGMTAALAGGRAHRGTAAARTRRRTGRRTAAHRGTAACLRPVKITALVSLHLASFLRQTRRNDLGRAQRPRPTLCPPGVGCPRPGEKSCSAGEKRMV